MLFTRRLLASLCLLTRAPLRPVQPASADEPPVAASVFSKTFTEGSLGLELSETPTGLTQVKRVAQGGAAWARGVPPLVIVVGVNGKAVSGLRVAEVQALIKQAPRPVAIEFDGSSAYAGLRPDEIVKKASEAQGMETATLRIDKTPANQGLSCGMRSAVSDVIEFEYEAALAETGYVFDSSAQRSGRPFALLLGNGDAVRGLELGLLEMCVGEERTLRVPPELGFGRRGNKLYGVPPDAPLIYQVKLVSINMQTDPRTRRADLPDEQRF
jgi:FK506-binding protein 2